MCGGRAPPPDLPRQLVAVGKAEREPEQLVLDLALVVRKDDVRGPLDVYVLDLSVPSFDRPDGHGTEADGTRADWRHLQ